MIKNKVDSDLEINKEGHVLDNKVINFNDCNNFIWATHHSLCHTFLTSHLYGVTHWLVSFSSIISNLRLIKHGLIWFRCIIPINNQQQQQQQK